MREPSGMRAGRLKGDLASLSGTVTQSLNIERTKGRLRVEVAKPGMAQVC